MASHVAGINIRHSEFKQREQEIWSENQGDIILEEHNSCSNPGIPQSGTIAGQYAGKPFHVWNLMLGNRIHRANRGRHDSFSETVITNFTTKWFWWFWWWLWVKWSFAFCPWKLKFLAIMMTFQVMDQPYSFGESAGGQACEDSYTSQWAPFQVLFTLTLIFAQRQAWTNITSNKFSF